LAVLLSVTLPVPVPSAQRAPATSSRELLFEAIELRAGSTACEVGAGDGTLTLEAARLVGPSGRVYTNELGDTRVQRLRTAVEASGLAHITVVAGEATKTNFPDQACDALFLRDVYHHFTDPAEMGAAIHSAVKPGGRVAVVDFTPPGEEATPPGRARDGSHGVYPETVVRELQQAGFEPLSSESRNRWFVVVLTKKGAASFPAKEAAPF
jgi:ubiquinone/menaquinone biosynthesis C-methylase UbiE